MPNTEHLLCALGEGWLRILRNELLRLHDAHISVVIVFTSPEQNLEWPETFVLSEVGTHAMDIPLCVAPKASASQMSLFNRHLKEEWNYASSNLRKLQYVLRQVDDRYLLPALQPYALGDLWEDEDAPSAWNDSALTTEEVETLAFSIGSRYDVESIRMEIRAFYQRRDALRGWWPALKEHGAGLSA